jgi:DNA polymerase III gamma/tau subunit
MSSELSYDYLAKALQDNCLPSTLLFSGPGAKTAAFEIAAKLLDCSLEKLHSNNHVDFHHITPDSKGGLHSIESMRSAIVQTHHASFCGKALLFLIEAADRMQPAAANALLKTLEEPPPKCTWILVSQRAQDILETIVSRCTKLEFSAEVIRADTPAEQLLEIILREKHSYLAYIAQLEKLEKLIEGETFAPTALRMISHHLHELEIKQPSKRYQEILSNITLALERNIKLYSCLEYLFLKSSYN